MPVKIKEEGGGRLNPAIQLRGSGEQVQKQKP